MSRYFKFDGRTQNIADWAREFGMTHSALVEVMRRGNKALKPVTRAEARATLATCPTMTTSPRRSRSL
jgi:hypothetical protein